MFSGLVSIDSNLETIPDLAESWDVSENGTLYTFKLRENIKFSDGSSVTANDFLYSFNRAANPDTESPVAELYLGEATTLEVQLNLEVIEEGSVDELPAPENLFQGGSQRQQSELEFRDVNGLAGYSSASALDIEVVFWEYRDLVKDYFLGIRPLRENDNRNR